MYYIIVGAGHVGSNPTRMALEDGHEVILIEENAERAAEANDQFDAMVLHADVGQSGILSEAGADHADVLVATTGDDSANLMAMFLGTEHKIKTLISIVNDFGHKPLFERIGVKIFSDPDLLVAQHLYRMIRTPSVCELVSLPDGGEIFDITVGEDAAIAGLTVAEAVSRKVLPPGYLIVSLRRGKVVRAPKGETQVAVGDHLTVFTEDKVGESHLKAFTG